MSSCASSAGRPLVNRQQLFSFTFFSILLLLIWQLGVILSPFFYPIMWARHSRHHVLSALPKTPAPAWEAVETRGGDHDGHGHGHRGVAGRLFDFSGINEAVQAYDTVGNGFEKDDCTIWARPSHNCRSSAVEPGYVWSPVILSNQRPT